MRVTEKNASFIQLPLTQLAYILLSHSGANSPCYIYKCQSKLLYMYYFKSRQFSQKSELFLHNFLLKSSKKTQLEFNLSNEK